MNVRRYNNNRQNSQNNQNTTEECPICIQAIESSHRSQIIKCKDRRCNTKYHRSCMLTWIRQNEASHGNNSNSSHLKKCIVCTCNTIDIRVRLRPRVISVRNNNNNSVEQTEILRRYNQNNEINRQHVENISRRDLRRIIHVIDGHA